jgi:FKBP-type peptidyl-prolyl cis-trans isomerase FkpA
MKIHCAISKWSFILVLVLLGSCKTPVQEKQEKAIDPYTKPLLQANKYMQERNREQIHAFIARTGWEMQETESGLWYMILEPGDGASILQDNMVVYSYKTRLLSGKFCYGADTTNPKKIVIGNGGVEAGIEEGLKLLKENGKARLIVPPYLAHGNFGDQKEIPAAAILLVELDVIRVRR